MFGSDTARALHAEFPAIDLHADTLMWSRWVGYDLAERHAPPLPRAAFAGHVDLPRLVEGGIGAQFFGLVSLPFSKRGNAAAVDQQIDKLDAQASSHPDKVRKVMRAEEIEVANREGVVAALLGIEGAHALDGDIDKIEHFARRGVRYLGFSHFSSNDAAYPAFGVGRNDNEGLTAFGRDLVRRCESLGTIVDLAHINKRGFLDVCEMATVPPIVSHTGIAGAFEHWRNIDDEQLRALAEKGGVAGIIFCPRFLGGDGLDPVIAHIEHIIDIAGEDTPALGSDWDGMIVPTRDLRDAAHLPKLTDALLQAGFSKRVIGKILRENVMRVLREVPVRI